MFRDSPLSAAERARFFEAFVSVCEWTQVFCLWPPNLRDEGDNHLIELAVAGGADLIVTNNLRDFGGSDLRFTQARMGLSVNRLIDELATVALTEYDSETRFRTKAARGSKEAGLALLAKLDRAYRKE